MMGRPAMWLQPPFWAGLCLVSSLWPSSGWVQNSTIWSHRISLYGHAGLCKHKSTQCHVSFTTDQWFGYRLFSWLASSQPLQVALRCQQLCRILGVWIATVDIGGWSQNCNFSPSFVDIPRSIYLHPCISEPIHECTLHSSVLFSMPIDLVGHHFRACFSVDRFRCHWAGVASGAIVMLGPEGSKPDGTGGKSDDQNPAESPWWVAGFSCRVSYSRN